MPAETTANTPVRLYKAVVTGQTAVNAVRALIMEGFKGRSLVTDDTFLATFSPTADEERRIQFDVCKLSLLLVEDKADAFIARLEAAIAAAA